MDFEPLTIKARCVFVEQYDKARRATFRADNGCEFAVQAEEGTVAYEAVTYPGRVVHLTITPECPEWAEFLKPMAGAAT